MSSGEGSRGISYGNPFLRASSRLHQQTTRNTAQHPSSVPAARATTSSSKVMTSSLSNENASGNPFFAQLAKKDNPAVSSDPAANNFPPPPPPPFPTTQTVPRPPSYASALTGIRHCKVPFPDLCTRCGPGTIPMQNLLYIIQDMLK